MRFWKMNKINILMKKMFVRSPEVKVMNRNVLTKEIEHDLNSLANRLTIWEINQIYNDLSRYGLADAQTKQAHIDTMKYNSTRILRLRSIVLSGEAGNVGNILSQKSKVYVEYLFTGKYFK